MWHYTVTVKHCVNMAVVLGVAINVNPLKCGYRRKLLTRNSNHKFGSKSFSMISTQYIPTAPVPPTAVPDTIRGTPKLAPNPVIVAPKPKVTATPPITHADKLPTWTFDPLSSTLSTSVAMSLNILIVVQRHSNEQERFVLKFPRFLKNILSIDDVQNVFSLYDICLMARAIQKSRKNSETPRRAALPKNKPVRKTLHTKATEGKFKKRNQFKANK